MLLSDGATGLAFSQKGVAILDGEEIYVEKVMAKDLESWKRRKGLELGDMRLLGDHKDAAGKRRLDLNSAVELMKGGGDDETESDFPIQGTRAAKEYIIKQWRWGRMDSWPIMSNGFDSRGCRNVLRLPTSTGICVRDSDCCIRGIKLMVQQQQLESTSVVGPYKRNLLDGRASASKFGEWVTSKLKERSQIWKQERLYAQERRQAKGGGKGPRRDDHDSDDDAGVRKKKKQKNKGGKGGIKTPPLRPSGLRSEGELLGHLVFHLRHDSRLQVV